MTRKEAMEFNEELKKFMEEQAVELGLEKEVGSKFVEQYVEIHPDEIPMMGMLDLKKKGTYSIKGGNVLVNQQAFLQECISFGLEFQIPETGLAFIKLFIRIFIGICNLMKVQLGEYESYIIAYLHSHWMYNTGDEENIFYKNFSCWYEKQTENKLDHKQIKDAIENLIVLKTIAIEDGEIRLKEKVWRDTLNN